MDHEEKKVDTEIKDSDRLSDVGSDVDQSEASAKEKASRGEVEGDKQEGNDYGDNSIHDHFPCFCYVSCPLTSNMSDKAVSINL